MQAILCLMKRMKGSTHHNRTQNLFSRDKIKIVRKDYVDIWSRICPLSHIWIVIYKQKSTAAFEIIHSSGWDFYVPYA